VRKSALLWFGLVVTALVALGLVVLSSASEANALKHYGSAYAYMIRQGAYLAGGIVICAAVALFDYHNWRDHEVLSWLMYAMILGLLVAVLFSRAINGSHRWLNFGPVRLQPSELAKLATVIVLAVWLDKSGWRVELFMRGALWPSALIGVVALPILFEPDFGSVMVVGAVGFLLMFVSGTRILHMVPFALAGGAVVVYKVLTNANRVERLFNERALYQVNMALAAIGNGGIWGVGLGDSMQKQLYLPEAHTDFVFAVGAEELGIVFSVFALLLFVAFFLLSVYIARQASDRFGRFLVVGMSFLIFFQAMFNIGVVCKALPTKGMALPFFSYGGTNLLSAFFAVGTILSVGIHSYRDRVHMLGRKVLTRA